MTEHIPEGFWIGLILAWSAVVWYVARNAYKKRMDHRNRLGPPRPDSRNWSDEYMKSYRKL